MNIDRAIEIAVSAHKGQVDKGGNPYILHPLRVMMSLDTEQEMIVGVLHDVVEDSEWTFDDLKTEGFSDEIIEALNSVTKMASEKGSDDGYFQFVRRAKQHAIGAKVKIADLRDNLDVSRVSDLGEDDMKRINKYKWSLDFFSK